ncbi:Aste57867_10320 [Aphanomyces stellatus]|uniref:Aste57867_10320 protein n=1 Tax=Aphanomyces stellatus TaxID=120398 RepID=A0A485KQ11_9STRA|nr:hypothetical protein As57867_010280 [Aphanomyces stellatus]VFT87194.1 Aste57867_10320 [Aphanomyces stellatus]
MKTALILSLTASMVAPQPTACDVQVMMANNQPFSQACTNVMQGGPPPTFGAVSLDITANAAQSIYSPGFCGSTVCMAELNAQLAAYPTCTPTSARSLKPALATLASSCASMAPAPPGTCQLEDYSDYNFAKYRMPLGPNCAVATGNSPTTLWNTVRTTLTLSPSNVITSAYCGSPDCVRAAQLINSNIGNCTFSPTNESLLAVTSDLLAYCGTNPNMYANGTCDADIVAANQAYWSPACVNDLQGDLPPTVAAVAVDVVANPAGVFATGICGSANCATQLNTIVSSYPTCTAVSATSYLTALTNLKTSCTGVATGVSTTRTCSSLDTSDFKWASTRVNLDPNCAAALVSSGAPGTFTPMTLWYSLVPALTLVSTNALTGAYCASPSCVGQANMVLGKLNNCGVAGGENLFAEITSLLAYCTAANTPIPVTPTPIPGTPVPVTPTPVTPAPATPAPATPAPATPTPSPTKSAASTWSSTVVAATILSILAFMA